MYVLYPPQSLSAQRRRTFRFYKAYLTFFTKVVQELGPDAALEKYVFSPEANWDSTDKTGNKHPEMLNRFNSGLVHPMIHAGYGLEFKLPGMVMEGSV
jgi:hypothetical protein